MKVTKLNENWKFWKEDNAFADISDAEEKADDSLLKDMGLDELSAEEIEKMLNAAQEAEVKPQEDTAVSNEMNLDALFGGLGCKHKIKPLALALVFILAFGTVASATSTKEEAPATEEKDLLTPKERTLQNKVDMLHRHNDLLMNKLDEKCG